MTTTTDMQNTIFGELVPTIPHATSPIDCSDETVCEHRDVHYDVAGGAHSNADDRFDANVALVREILQATEEWSNEYHTENSDHADGYACIINEGKHDWPNKVEEWANNAFEEFVDGEWVNEHAGCMDKLVEHIVEGIDDFDPEYESSGFSCYNGEGLCLDSFEVGECEEQIDINQYPVLKALHELRELDDVLDELDGDFCINRDAKRVKNEETGHYEHQGRKTYMPYEHNVDYPTFEIYTMPGGQWYFVVSAESMNELVEEFLEDSDG
jgi:hypothetical protein